MKIGILTYHAVYNFGANLQALSTYEYLRRHGHEPVVIDFFPEDLEKAFERTVPPEQGDRHKAFVKEHFILTSRCRNTKDVSRQIKEHDIDAVIIGSDAVVQHFPLLSRIRISPSSRKLISFSIETVRYETNFPNPFWGEFIESPEIKAPAAMMSVSCQNTDYKLFSGRDKKAIRRLAEKMAYISVRDNRTRKMFENISKGDISPVVTPDPVFAFNDNVFGLPSQEQIFSKFGLPEKYILLSFNSPRTVSREWVSSFASMARREGYEAVALAMPGGIRFSHGLDQEVNIPLDPADWYSLIKYSSGYIGEKMHPVIVSLHNSVPFYSFDHYGILKFKIFLNQEASKISHILERAGFNDHRTSIARRINYKVPGADYILERILDFDRQKCSVFADAMREDYREMMEGLLKSLTEGNY